MNREAIASLEQERKECMVLEEKAIEREDYEEADRTSNKIDQLKEKIAHLSVVERKSQEVSVYLCVCVFVCESPRMHHIYVYIYIYIHLM